MNYNYNQFGQYPYNYTQPQPAYQQYQQPQQTQYIPLTFVSGIEGAKAFIVGPNQTVYLRDSDSDIIFIKSADPQGRYTLKIYNLVPTEEVKKTVKNEFASLEALEALKRDLEDRMNEFSSALEKLNINKNGGQ